MSLCYIAKIPHIMLMSLLINFIKKKINNHTNFITYDVILVNNLNNSC